MIMNPLRLLKKMKSNILNHMVLETTYNPELMPNSILQTDMKIDLMQSVLRILAMIFVRLLATGLCWSGGRLCGIGWGHEAHRIWSVDGGLASNQRNEATKNARRMGEGV